MKNWISITEKLPEEGNYVIAKHNRKTWHDSTDQENVNTVIVKLVKGISKEEREILRNENESRGFTYTGADEDGNNLVPYCFKTFGATSFFGQEITHWMDIPKVN